MKGDNCRFRHDIDKRGKSSPSNPSPNSFMRQNERKPIENPKSQRKKSVVECLDCFARITSKEVAITHFENSGTLQNACSTRPSGCRFGEKCSYAHRQIDEQPTKRSKKNDDKSAVAMLKKGDWHERGPVTDQCHDRSGKPDERSDKKLGQKSSQLRSFDARQLGCVFQDMTPPKSILRKCTDMRKPIQRVKFTKAIARHTNSRPKSFARIYLPSEPHERSPNAPKFEDLFQEETEWQEQVAREAAWKLAKHVLKSKEHIRATFFSPSENRCLLASTVKPEEREFVVDSGASMHMISKKDL